MTLDEQFMAEAIKEAELAGQEGNWPMGCVLVVDGKIIARAHNSGFSDKNRLAHAELKALVEARAVLETQRRQATLYTTYEPCPMCFGAIVMMKVGRVVTGVDLDNSGCLDLQPHLPAFFRQPKFAFTVTRGVLAAECQRVYQQGAVGAEHLTKIAQKRFAA